MIPTYHLCRLSDGRVMFAPPDYQQVFGSPSHTFPDETAARWFVRGWHYALHPRDTKGFKVEVE